ncbi:MAG TPA: GTP 3',8-cyclase MoaA [Anaerolineaceae bacterium]
MLVDRFGRSITYLRVSVTDRCNLRCVYCMPPEGIVRQAHESIMRYEEIAAVVRVAAEAGIRKVRITGGEPLVRAGLPGLVRMIAAVPGIEDISLTTNGLLLERMAGELKDAGLTRINVSLDTLNPEKFTRITRGGKFETTWRGLEAAERLGLNPIKINVVAMRGVNDDELVDLARLSVERDWHVRFIELMPVNNQQPWGPGFPAPADIYLPIPEIKTALAPLGLVPVPAHLNDGPAVEYSLQGGKGRIGFISPLSEHFCQQCNRLRLTADGNLRPCLLQDIEVPILAALRAGEPVLPYIQQAIDSKPSGHELAQAHLPTGRCMMQIGG